ncbi:hypothetical protein ACFYWU_13045 [Streptomyces chrestomyceticus]|uniref:hypothetical protein n=1 Tax=Streptomyces chrestomyceticus TaxID=68185 RepID=UPI00367C03DB
MSPKSADYGDTVTPEHALKYALRHAHGGRAQLRLGYTRIPGPLPYGTPLHIPDPFGLDLDTGDW